MWLDLSWRRVLSRRYVCEYCQDNVVVLSEEFVGPTHMHEPPPKPPFTTCELSLDGGKTWERSSLDGLRRRSITMTGEEA